MDTIFALTTPEGKSGVAVVRVSGLRAFDCFKNFNCMPVKPNKKGLRKLYFNNKLLDEALVLCFKRGHSFTGENTVEIHLHGSLAIIKTCLGYLGSFGGFRIADPGEFTKRAFENGRLDLSQVEGLSELIDAETSVQLDQAQRVFEGFLGKKVAVWRSEVIDCKALIEASIDFVDEDVPLDLSDEILKKLLIIKTSIQKEIDGSFVSEKIKSGFEIAIIGAPNVGKSTLLNALAGREAAITSKVAGTTRDVIEVSMDLAGIPISILDTAGIRASENEVEKIGISLALARAKRSDLRLFVSDNNKFDYFGLNLMKDDLRVNSKIDLNKGLQGDVSISAKYGDGIDKLLDLIKNIFKHKVSKSSIATNARHRGAMSRSVSSLERAEEELLAGINNVELCAEELNTAIRAMDSLIGVVDVEDVLGKIFSKFCIGK
jgi:tRNA modification GTPase